MRGFRTVLALLTAVALIGSLDIRLAHAQVEQIDVWVDPGHGGGDSGNIPIDNDPDHYESQITIQGRALRADRDGGAADLGGEGRERTRPPC